MNHTGFAASAGNNKLVVAVARLDLFLRLQNPRVWVEKVETSWGLVQKQARENCSADLAVERGEMEFVRHLFVSVDDVAAEKRENPRDAHEVNVQASIGETADFF